MREDGDLLMSPTSNAGASNQQGTRDDDLLIAPDAMTNAASSDASDDDLLDAPPDCKWKLNGQGLDADPAAGRLAVTSRFAATYTAPPKFHAPTQRL